MGKQPTRLADFQIPRGEATVAEVPQPEQSAPLATVETTALPIVAPASQPPALVPAAPAIPTMATLPQAEAPTDIPRRALGARVPVVLAERLRGYLYVSRRSQQEVVEAALDAYLRERGA